MNLGQQLENAPKNLVLYVLGLIGAVVDDYTLITLLIFCVLLGFILHAVLIPLAVFFGAFFVLRLVSNVAESIGHHAKATAQTNMQVAAAIAQLAPSSPPGFELVDVPDSNR
jgi:uncharacterized membrane protein YagU involved in acid resistance